MFFSGFPRMVGLSLFPTLSSLTVVGQSINSIHSLDYCPLLKELWVVECKLNEICGLHNCVHLQKLFLYENHIQQIPNLEMLVDLHILWLNKNQISDIQVYKHLEDTQMECELSHIQSACKGDPEDLTSDLHNEHSHEQRMDIMVHFLLLELETFTLRRETLANLGTTCMHARSVVKNTTCRITDLYYSLLPLSGSRHVAISCCLVSVCGIINLTTSLTLKSIESSRSITKPCGKRFQDKSARCLLKYKRCMEYLFYMPEPEHSYERDEILQILENGFKTGNAYKALGRERAVPLSVSVSDRLCCLSFLCYCISVVKAAMCVCVCFCSSDLLGPSSLPDICDCRQWQKLWYMFNFPSSSHTSPTDAPSVSLTERDLDEEALKMGPILKHHPKLLSLDEKSILTVTRTNVLSQITVRLTIPNIHKPHMTLSFSDAIILFIHNLFLFHLLNMTSLLYFKDSLCAMHHLTHLSINSNHLQCLDREVLDQLPNLDFLSVENNIISSLHGLQRSQSLSELYVSNNDISTIDLNITLCN
uniref:Leucine rich repeat containing 9 n=1 Tax=Cyprinus carpio carpio TaxID=630221 RepID=A0A9J8BPZ2_CYPCA